MNLARVSTAVAACVVLGAAVAACSGSFGSGSGLPNTMASPSFGGNASPTPPATSSSVILTYGESTAFQPLPEVGGYGGSIAFPKAPEPTPAPAPKSKGKKDATPEPAPTPVAVSIGATLSIVKPQDGPDLNFVSGKGKRKRSRASCRPARSPTSRCCRRTTRRWRAIRASSSTSRARSRRSTATASSASRCGTRARRTPSTASPSPSSTRRRRRRRSARPPRSPRPAAARARARSRATATSPPPTADRRPRDPHAGLAAARQLRGPRQHRRGAERRADAAAGPASCSPAPPRRSSSSRTGRPCSRCTRCRTRPRRRPRRPAHRRPRRSARSRRRPPARARRARRRRRRPPRPKRPSAITLAPVSVSERGEGRAYHRTSDGQERGMKAAGRDRASQSGSQERQGAFQRSRRHSPTARRRR